MKGEGQRVDLPTGGGENRVAFISSMIEERRLTESRGPEGRQQDTIPTQQPSCQDHRTMGGHCSASRHAVDGLRPSPPFKHR